MRTSEHTGYVQSIQGNYGVVYSKTWNEEYYFDINSQTKHLKKMDNVVFLVTPSSYYKEEKATALRKIFTNSKGMVFYPRVDQTHIHLDIERFLPYLIDQVKDKSQEIVEIEYEFNEVIGQSLCVEVSENDTIVYAIRKGRNKHTKFVLNRNAENCKSVFAVFKKTELGYLILTIFIGKKAGREPWDNFATLEDKKFWSNHALIFDSNEIIQNTITKTCPVYCKNTA